MKKKASSPLETMNASDEAKQKEIRERRKPLEGIIERLEEIYLKLQPIYEAECDEVGFYGKPWCNDVIEAASRLRNARDDLQTVILGLKGIKR